MPIEMNYENIDQLPEPFRNEAVLKELFTVGADGKVSLTGVSGMKTQADVDYVKEALRKEREETAKAQAKLKPWGQLDPEATLAQLDRIKELEAVAGGKLDETKLNELVEGRLSQKIGPVQRQLDTVTEERDAARNETAQYKAELENRDRREIIRSAAAEAAVVPTAIADMEMAAASMLEKDASGELVSKAGIYGLTPGLPVKEWIKEMQKLRPHWWPPSEGGNAPGGAGLAGLGGTNPFSHDDWNVTAQGKLIQEHGSEIAGRLAKAAGTTVGGSKPMKK